MPTISMVEVTIIKSHKENLKIFLMYPKSSTYIKNKNSLRAAQFIYFSRVLFLWQALGSFRR